MILPDHVIRNLCEHDNFTYYYKNYSPIYVRKPLISPFVDKSIKEHGVSYGLSSAGYDARLADEFLIADDIKEIVDIANFGEDQSIKDRLFKRYKTKSLIIYPGQFVLARAQEYYCIPTNVVATVNDKSSCARLAVAAQNTVLEPGWEGHITLELTNHMQNPVRIHAGMGIVQIMFQLLLDEPEVPYNKRDGGKGGKYQGQLGVTVSRV